MPSTMPDKRTLEAACRGNSKAFAEVADAHYKTVYGVAFSVVGNWSAAQDIAQETFLLAWLRRDSLRNALAFPVWLRRIASNLSITWIRSAQFRRRLADHYGALAPVETDPRDAADAQLDGTLRRSDVWGALETLSPTLREAIVLYYLHGETLRDVASALGISENAAKKRLQHGRAKLRAHFESRWKAEMVQARGAVDSRSARDRFLAGLALGPAMPELGRSAASTGLGLWWEVTRQTALSHKALTGVAVVSAKKIGGIAIAALLLASGAYWAATVISQRPPATAARAKIAEQKPATKRAGQVPATMKSAVAPTPGAEPPVVEASKPVITPIEIADPKDYITLRGKVIDETGAPLPGADVSVAALGLPQPPENGSPEVITAHVDAYKHYLARRNHYWNAVSDENGEFTITGIRFAGATMVTGHAAGYMAKMQYLRMDTTGVYPQLITLQMKPGIAIRGRLLSSDGQPVTDSSVKLEGFVTASSGQGGVIGLAVFTDKDGYFDLDVDEPGTMSLTADSETYGITSFSSIAADPDQELELRYPPATAVFGRVTDDHGGAVPNVEVRLEGGIVTKMPENGSRSVSRGTTFSAMTSSTGAFRVQVDPAQQYGTSVFGKDGALLTKGRAVDALKPGADYELNIQVRPQMVVRGTVLGAKTGRPLEGITVVALPADAFNPSTRNAGSGNSFSATSAKDGTYGITVSGDGGLYALTTTYTAGVWMGQLQGTTDSPRVSLEPGETITQDLRVSEPISRSFQVVDAGGSPVEGAEASIQVRTENGAAGFGAGAQTDASGHVTLAAIPPDCEVTVRFSKSGYVTGASTVQSGAPGQTFPEERIELHQSAAFSAVLIGPDGQPLADRDVKVTGRFGEHGEITDSIRTDASGAFSMSSSFPATKVSIGIAVAASQDGNDSAFYGEVEGVALTADAPTDLGEVRLSSKS